MEQLKVINIGSSYLDNMHDMLLFTYEIKKAGVVHLLFYPVK
jgi:hypothetical protein